MEGLNEPVALWQHLQLLDDFPRVWRLRFETHEWAYSSVWLERTPDKREVGGSSPPRPTISPAGN